MTELKSLLKPADVIKLVFDCVLLLLGQPLVKPAKAEVSVGSGRSRHDVEFVGDSYVLAKVPSCLAVSLMYASLHRCAVRTCWCLLLQRGVVGDVNFLRILLQFSEHQRDCLNDETIELLAPYLELPDFDVTTVRNVSRAGASCVHYQCRF